MLPPSISLQWNGNCIAGIRRVFMKCSLGYVQIERASISHIAQAGAHVNKRKPFVDCRMPRTHHEYAVL